MKRPRSALLIEPSSRAVARPCRRLEQFAFNAWLEAGARGVAPDTEVRSSAYGARSQFATPKSTAVAPTISSF